MQCIQSRTTPNVDVAYPATSRQYLHGFHHMLRSTAQRTHHHWFGSIIVTITGLALSMHVSQ